MVNTLVCVLALAASAVQGFALPSTAPLRTRPEGVGRYGVWTRPGVDLWAGRDHPLGNSSHTDKTKRQFATSECALGDEIIYVQDEGAAEGDHPQAYTQLWDAVYDTCSGALNCSPNQQTCVMATTDLELCVQPEGNWQLGDGPIYLDAAREIFDRTVVYNWNAPTDDFAIWQGAVEFAIDEVTIRDAGGNGYFAVKFTTQPAPGQCGNTANTIASLGQLLAAQAAPFFGIISLICAGMQAGQIPA